MWSDPIVEDIHKIRHARAKQFNYDLMALFNYLKDQERKSKLKVVSLPIKRQQPEAKAIEVLAI